MSQIPNTILWIGLCGLIILSLFAIDRLVRLLFNRFYNAQQNYPHRVANELPRVLHKSDRDEVLDLADERDAATKS